jgi:hypothetical protein
MPTILGARQALDHEGFPSAVIPAQAGMTVPAYAGMMVSA